MKSFRLSWLCLAALLACSAQAATPSASAKAGPKAAAKSPPKPAPKNNNARARLDLGPLCAKLSPRLPGVSQQDCKSSGLLAASASSRSGVPILYKDQAAKAKNPVRVLLLGGIHGDELTASAIVFQWMRWLQTPQAQAFQWRVAPLVNPDGLLAAKPKRMNASGIDLNRNFPTPNWKSETQQYWVKKTGSDPRRFPGNQPLSEPESRWVHDQIERFKPHVVISVHAPFGVLDFDGPSEPPQRFGRLLFNPVGVYPGSLGNYLGVQRKLPIVTIELPNSLEMPPPPEVQRIWQDMLVWMRNNIHPVAAKPAKAAKNLKPGKSVAAAKPPAGKAVVKSKPSQSGN
ncbi:M14 family zinc carboxypeptidase [Massilia sp. W12]|uniref:M14 family zinc carboxypeptidase n=1 Tax=Massilia sp. W12 TaxID=3126507 RepID=UPI0030CC4168